MNYIIFSTFIAILVFNACVGHKSSRTKIQPSEVFKAADPSKSATIQLTSEAKNRLEIMSQAFPRGKDAKQAVPISALLYDTAGFAWFFVEDSVLRFHREKVRVLKTENNRILVESTFDASLPVVIQGAAELNGIESGVGK
jgi:hypothetical protein